MKYLDQGGTLFLGPSYPNREVLPDWLVDLTDGGWEEGIIPDKAVVANAEKVSSNQKLLDEIDVNNLSSENSHGVTFTGETFEDTQNLPDALNEKENDPGYGKGFYGLLSIFRQNHAGL